MKKALTVIALLFSLNTTYAQDSTKLTAKQVYNDVRAGFDRLVNNLEGPAKYTYESYVRYYNVHGIAILIGYIIPMVVLLIVVVLSFKRGTWENLEPKNKWASSQIWSTILLGALTLGLILSIGTILTEIFNPQYHAIHEIIKTLK